MLRVRDIMTPTIVSVCADDTAKSAAERLAVEGVSGAPVRDAGGALVGVLSQSDLTNARLAGKVRHPTVADLMTPDVLSVYADDPALSAVTGMAQHDIHRVFVVDADNQLAGVVSALDVVKALARGAQFEVNAGAGGAAS